MADNKNEVIELRQKLEKILKGTVRALSSTVEKRDFYTARHQQRVAKLACAIAREIGLPEEQINGIRVAGLLHDIGKIHIPAEILNKPSELTDIEMELIKSHPKTGYEILKLVEFPWPVAQIVLQHHERMNGSGYPQSLSGTDILIEARILGIADVVEAMVSHRPYRPAHGINETLDEISRNSGNLYDSKIADACLKLFAGKKFEFPEIGIRTLSDLMKPELICLNLKSARKDASIIEMAEMLHKKQIIRDEKDFTEKVFRRENLGSSGIGQGVAIPHARTAQVRETKIAFGRSIKGIEFESLDEKPVHLIFLIASPRSDNELYLGTLARLSQLLIGESFRETLLKAGTKEEILLAISRFEEKLDSPAI